MAGLVLRPRARMLRGHDWVFSSEVLKTFGAPRDGDVVSIKDGRDRLLGSAIYNSRSRIVARRFSRRRQELDADFFQRRILQAVDYRRRLGRELALARLVWSESDGLPGVIADRYGPVVVLQTTALGMDLRREMIAAELMKLPGVECVIERNDTPARRSEGLEARAGMLAGQPPGLLSCELAGVRFEVDPLHGQKTGLYLDQTDNYLRVARHAEGRRVLDCFSNQGGFALACARAGATEVTAVESGAAAVARLEANAAANNLRVDVRRADVFDFLPRLERGKAEYDLIVLDPPSFAKDRGGMRSALRGYRELHLRAAGLLAERGILATFTCSHHIGPTELREAVLAGCAGAGKSFRLLETLRQSADHPVLLGQPETEYLHGLLLEVCPGR